MKKEQEKLIAEYKAKHFITGAPIDSNEELRQFLHEHCPDTMDDTTESEPITCPMHGNTMTPDAVGIYHCSVDGCTYISW